MFQYINQQKIKPYGFLINIDSMPFTCNYISWKRIEAWTGHEDNRA